MVVDDEVLVRIGMQSLINWEEHGYQIVCDASDGEEAFEKIRQYQPDIVLTDLKMAPVDGFELIEKCQGEFSYIQFIILSNYNDFENVRKAMKLGAVDYIFKLTVRPEDLIKVLKEASVHVKTSDHAKNVNEINGKNLNLIKKELLKKVITSETFLNIHMEELKNLSFKINFDIEFSILYLTIDNFKIVRKKGDFLELELLLFTMENIIEELFGRHYRAEVFQWGEYDFMVILNCKEQQDYEIFAAAIKKEFHIFVNYTRQYYGIEVSGGLSKGATGIKALKCALEQNEEILEQRFFAESGHLHRYKRTIKEEIHVPAKYQVSTLKKLSDAHDFYGMEQFLSAFFSFLKNQEVWKPEEVRGLLRRVYRTLAIAYSAVSVDIDSYVDHNGVDMESAINEYSFLKNIFQSVTEVMEQCRAAFESNRGGIKRREIAAVKSFVMGHLQEEISLPEIAEMVNMSASHFSHIFKKEEGVSFMEYVGWVRMERAKHLLKNSDLKVNEIAEQIGIGNPNYFSAQFKKRVGRSPLEYRQEYLNNSRI